MRMIRSILCASLAMIAVAVCASMPAAASVPIDPGAIVQPLDGKYYPAPVAVTIADEAVMQVSVASVSRPTDGRSSIGASASRVAPITFNPPAYRHIDPDIAG